MCWKDLQTMRDLRPDLDTLWRAAGRLTPAKGARALMFMSASEGTGTSSIAASFALMTADRARRTTWLVDLDLRDNPLIEAFQNGFADGVGRPGRAYDASLNQLAFYDIISTRGAQRWDPAGVRSKLLAVHQIRGTRLMVTRFRNEHLSYGQKVRLSTRPDWWRQLRRSADWIIVDAPALDRAGAGLAMASQMDGVVLVVQADRTSPEDVTALRQEIEGHGGHVLGVVMNRMRGDSLLADRLAG